jgi:hypothetical protein
MCDFGDGPAEPIDCGNDNSVTGAGVVERGCQPRAAEQALAAAHGELLRIGNTAPHTPANIGDTVGRQRRKFFKILEPRPALPR